MYCKDISFKGGNSQIKGVSSLNSKSYTPCVCLPSLLELSLPKFSLSTVTDVRDLLTNMDPRVEAKLLGSEAEYSQLSKTNPFTIDKVRR